MGISILSGTFTTFGSGIFLAGGTISVFNKFSVLISTTVLFSFAVAMLLFGTIMHIVGP